MRAAPRPRTRVPSPGVLSSTSAASISLRPLMHAPDPVVAFRPARSGRGCKSAAVVFHLQRDPRRLVDQLHIDARGCGVAHGIGHRLLANAQQLLFDLARPPGDRCPSPEGTPWPESRWRCGCSCRLQPRGQVFGCLAASRERRSQIEVRASARLARTSARAWSSWSSADLRRRLARAGEQPGDQFQLHRDADKALGQGVVNLPRQASPLRQHRAPLRLHLQHPPAIDQVSQQQASPGPARNKTTRSGSSAAAGAGRRRRRRYSRPRHCWPPAPGSGSCPGAGWCKRRRAGCRPRSSRGQSPAAGSGTAPFAGPRNSGPRIGTRAGWRRAGWSAPAPEPRAWSSTRTFSITTGGGTWFSGVCAGSMKLTPSRVANHRLPSASFQAAGWPPPLHSRMFMPSAVP